MKISGEEAGVAGPARRRSARYERRSNCGRKLTSQGAAKARRSCGGRGGGGVLRRKIQAKGRPVEQSQATTSTAGKKTEKQKHGKEGKKTNRGTYLTPNLFPVSAARLSSTSHSAHQNEEAEILPGGERVEVVAAAGTKLPTGKRKRRRN